MPALMGMRSLLMDAGCLDLATLNEKTQDQITDALIAEYVKLATTK